MASALAAMFIIPAPALGDTTIGFEDLTPGTAITTQYHDAGGAGRGVDFGPAPPGEESFYQAFVYDAGTLAHGGSRVAAVQGNCGVEVCFTLSHWLSFPSYKQHVRLYVGDPYATDNANTITGTAYDANGIQIGATQSVGTSAPSTVFFPFDFSSSQRDIAYVKLTGNTKSLIAFDDLTFDNPSNVPPQFALTRTDGNGGIQLNQGQSSDVSLVLHRQYGSAGSITFGASGLPPGVHATFAPATTAGGEGTPVKLTLSVDSAAPAGETGTVTVQGAGDSTSGGQVGTVRVPITVVGGFNIRLKGIEVTQGVQSPGFLIPGGSFGNGDSYRGVELAAGGKTVVRVYADAVNPPPGGVPGVGVQLRGFDSTSHRELPGGPIFPIGGPSTLTQGVFPGVSQDDRTNPVGAYTFVLPPSWTHGKTDLHADVLPPSAPVFAGDPSYVECSDPSCITDNHYDLRDVEFTPVRTYTLDVLDLETANSLEPFPPVDYIFAVPRALAPLGEGQFVVRGPRFIVRNHDGDLNQQVSNWYHDNGQPGDAAMGVENLAPGGGGGQTWMNDHTAIASFGRPFTALSHEMFHLFGRQHASSACDGGDPAKPEGFENWPPDQQGYLHGIALDRRDESGISGPFHAGPFNIIASGIPGAGYTNAYDIMSYCALKNGEGGQWVSPSNWEAVLDSLRTGPAGSSPDAVRLAAAAPRLRVTATLNGAAQIVDVNYTTTPDFVPGIASDYRLIARGRGGQVLSDSAMGAQAVHSEPHGGQVVLTGDVPASSGVVELDVVHGAITVATRRRSAHAPTVRLLAPRAHQVVGKGRSVTVRWKAKDADGDPLQERIDYSLNGGRTWMGIGADEGTNSMTLPSSLFARSKRARVRVVVSDGFNQTQAVSGLVKAIGRPPTVHITDPVRGERLPADGTLHLSGTAFDDRFASLGGNRLRWFDGRQLLGHGAQLAVSGLVTPGRRRIRLVATDRFRRTGSALVTVRITPAVPRFILINSPKKVRSLAKKVRLRLATSVPAKLQVRGQHFRLNRRARTISVRVPRGKRVLVLDLRLDSSGRRFRLTLRIPRR